MKSRIVLPASALLALVCGMLTVRAAERTIAPAFGPYVNPSPQEFAASETFTAKDRIVGTYYFYWYDNETKSHVLDEDGTDALTTHPPTLAGFSYKSGAWHRKQLLDMEAAGIDLALMVFWGSPAEHETNTVLHWSFAGLPPLIQAREELLGDGRRPPRIGLFYDTSTLQHNHWHYHADLTTDFGRRFFAATVRDFYSCIPAKHWAMMDGKPIVLLYAPAFAKNWDQSIIKFTKTEFARDFAGREPWLAPQDAWNLRGDGVCAWGGALSFRNPGIGEIGPGYDHSAVPGRTPLVRDREGGKFYEESWLKFLRRPSNFVMIETWNEFHEGTDIAESKEYGRRYIELTRKYADRFKSGWKPPHPTGPFAEAKVLSIELGATNRESGLRQIECEDGQTKAVNRAERGAREVQPFHQNSRYLYLAADDSFKWAERMDLKLEVDCFDSAPGRLHVEFDGSDANAPFAGAYTRSANQVLLTGSRTWQTLQFDLPAAQLRNGQNSGADLRLVGDGAELIVARVALIRP